MKINNSISIDRLGYLLKKDIAGIVSKTLIVTGAVAAFILFISALNAYNRPDSGQFYFRFFKDILFIGGFIITAGSFTDMHRKETAQSFLLLPASTFEKFLSRLILTSVGFAVLTIAGMMLLSYISEGINVLIFSRHNGLFNPLNKNVWLLVAHYMVIQSIFFFGSVYFRKYNFIKTVNVIFLFVILVSIVLFLFLRIVFFDFFSNFFQMNSTAFFFHWGNLNVYPENLSSLVTFIKISYWIIPAPLFWVISYFRVKEAEIKNAV